MRTFRRNIVDSTSRSDGLAQPQWMKDAIADAILSVSYDSLDDAVIEQAKRVFLYHIWTAFLGRKSIDMNASIGLSVIQDLGAAPGPCTVIGHDFKLTVPDAAYLNCHLIGGGGYDDVIFPSGMHAGLMVIPVAMAIAERQRASGRDFIASLVVGYEILGKIGRWTWSNDSPRRPGPVFGPMAAAGVASHLLGLDARQTSSAIGYAAHGAMGLPCNLNTQLHAMTCRTGILSAFYGKAGGDCPNDIIEGELGFFKTFFGSAPASAEELLNGFGHNYKILESREKRYPGTMLNLVAVEKARELINSNGLSAKNVESVALELSVQRSKHTTAQLKPPYRRQLEAFASCQFLIALLLLDGDILEDERSESKDDPEILDVASRVTTSFVDHPNPIYAKVRIRTVHGVEYEAKGHDHIFPPLDAKRQLQEYASDVLSHGRIDELVESVGQLQNSSNVCHEFALLTPDKQRHKL